jgi:hypothetical protein
VRRSGVGQAPCVPARWPAGPHGGFRGGPAGFAMWRSIPRPAREAGRSPPIGFGLRGSLPRRTQPCRLQADQFRKPWNLRRGVWGLAAFPGRKTRRPAAVSVIKNCFRPAAAQPGSARPGPAQPSPARQSPAKPSPARPSPAQPGPAQPGPPPRLIFVSKKTGPKLFSQLGTIFQTCWGVCFPLPRRPHCDADALLQRCVFRHVQSIRHLMSHAGNSDVAGGCS